MARGFIPARVRSARPGILSAGKSGVATQPNGINPLATISPLATITPKQRSLLPQSDQWLFMHIRRIHKTQLVPFRIPAIGSEVTFRVLWPRARRAFVVATHGNGQVPGSAHGLRRIGGEADLHAVAPRRGQTVKGLLHEYQGPALAGLVPTFPGRSRIVFAVHAYQSQATQDGIIKSDHPRQVSCANLYMTEQSHLLDE